MTRPHGLTGRLFVAAGALLLAAVFARAASAPQSATPNPDRAACTAWVNSQFETVHPAPPPIMRTHFLRYPLITWRYRQLAGTMQGYEASGIPLVRIWNDHFGPAGYADDPGMYWAVPALARALHLGMNEAIDLFFGGAMFLSFACGLAGIFLLYRRWIMRGAGAIFLAALFAEAWSVRDVRVFYALPVLFAVPLFLFFCRHSQRPRRLAVFFLVCGLGFGLAHEVRGQSATPALAFLLVVLLWGTQYSRRWKLIQCAALLVGLAVPWGIVRHAIAQEHAFLKATEPCYIPANGHVFWHVIYIGMGYVNNPYVPNAFLDYSGFDKARSINPNVTLCSPEYEAILRREVFRLVFHHPNLIVETLSAKAAYVICWIIIFANVGLIAAFLRPKRRAIECAFWLGIALESTFPILVFPLPSYLIGVMAFAAVYGIISIGNALEPSALDFARRTEGALST